VHVVTKILIVFGALLSILLSALAMAFASNANTIRGDVGSEISARQAAIAALDLERTKTSSELARIKAEMEAVAGNIGKFKQENETLSAERNRLMAEASQAKLEAERSRNLAAAKDGILQTNTKLVEALSTEANTLRTRGLDSAKREAELTERLSELESQNQVLTQNVRALQEQLAEARSAGSATASSGATAAVAAAPSGGVESFGPLVTGRVRKVVRAENGEDLAFITVGGSSGVKVGQRMHIVREGNFVASLIITVVDSGEAAGRIDRLGRSVDVLADDKVLSRVN
jgi:archaellum component FlaC